MSKYVIILLSCSLLVSCDWYHKNQCEWYLVPEPDDAHRVEAGWVSLCARNYVINKQRCMLKAKIKFAKAVHGKPFKYSSMQVLPGKYPKEVISIKTCKAE